MKNKQTKESKEFFCDTCQKIKYENEVSKDKKTKEYLCIICKNPVYEVNYLKPDIESAKDEAVLITYYCRSIITAASKIKKAQNYMQVKIEMGYLTEKIQKLNTSYKYLMQSVK